MGCTSTKNISSCNEDYCMKDFLNEQYHFLFELFTLPNATFVKIVAIKVNVIITMDDDIINCFDSDLSAKIHQLKNDLIQSEHKKTIVHSMERTKQLQKTEDIVAVAHLNHIWRKTEQKCKIAMLEERLSRM